MPGHSEGSGRGCHRQWEPCWSLAALRRAGVKNKDIEVLLSPLLCGQVEYFHQEPGKASWWGEAGELSLRDLVEDFIWLLVSAVW